nr:ParB family protein [Vibrio parahaemolyticus]
MGRFPVVNELSHTDYTLLNKVMQALESDKKKSQYSLESQPEQSSDEV